MEQIERIEHMEQLLDEVSGVVQHLAGALDEYQKVRSKLEELVRYYESEDWRQDFDDDCDGKLPPELKRGVLSEDAVYDLLMEHDRLCRQSGEQLREL